MTPTILRYKNCKFFFFSHEEKRAHVHVRSPHGEAKFWLEPVIALADYVGFSAKELTALERVVKKHGEEIRAAWKEYFNC